MRTDAIIAALSLPLVVASGCSSAKRDIQVGAERVIASAAAIRSDAQAIRDDAQDLAESVSPELADKANAINAAATRIDHEAERIGASASGIIQQSQRVQDIKPLWQTLLGMSAWSLLWIGVALVLAWFGLLPIVIRFIAGLAAQVPSLFKLLIPDSIRSSAKLDVEAFDAADPTMTAAVAARRQSDPRYDAAYRHYAKEAK